MFLDKITLILPMYIFTKLAAQQPRKESLLDRIKMQWLCDLNLWPWSWTFKFSHIIYAKCEYFMNHQS
jgi:hypothetical protein